MKPSIVIGLVLLVASSFTAAYAQWVPINGPDYGGVSCFAVSGTNLFAGTWHFGVFLSTNNGASWTVVNNGLTDSLVRALAVSGTYLLAGTYGGGVFLSTNNGTSWTAVNSGLANIHVTSLAVSGTNLFAGAGTRFYCDVGSSSVFLSTNYGTSWTAVTAPLRGCVRAFAVNGTNVFAGTDGGVFLSTNNGTSWTLVISGMTNPAVKAFAVLGTNLFAGTEGGVFLSTNNGTSWTPVNSGLTDSTFINAFAVSGMNLFAGNYGGVFLSTNNGTSWTAVNSGLPTNNTVVSAFAVSPNGAGGTNLIAATNSGVWRRPLSEMITSVDDRKALPVEFALEQNYPNPFNPSTTIRYALPQRAAVTLTVYNTLGQEVARLVQGEKEAGYHETVFDAPGLASGVYLYRLQAGAFTRTARMLLVR